MTLRALVIGYGVLMLGGGLVVLWLIWRGYRRDRVSEEWTRTQAYSRDGDRD